MSTPDHWHCVHVYYYDPDKDGLLLDAVRPLLAQVRDHVTAAYPLRHWRRGPHLRLHARTDPDTWRGVVRPAIDRIVGGYLREHPSTTQLDPSESLPRHQLLAAREQEPGPLTPWRPDNSIHDEEFDSRRHVLGSDAAVELLTGFYTDSTPPLFDMLQHTRHGQDDKAGIAVNLMLTVAHTVQRIERSFASYRSHAEGYLAWAADPAASRAVFDRAYQQRQSDLTRRVRDVVAALDDPQAPAVPFVREWAALLAGYRTRIDPLIAAGELTTPTTEQSPPPEQFHGYSVPRRERSEFHRLIFSSADYQQEVLSDPVFLRYRVLLNYTYLQLTRLGITPLERFCLCHLVANAVEDVYGIRAVDLIRDYVAARTGRSAARPSVPSAW